MLDTTHHYSNKIHCAKEIPQLILKLTSTLLNNNAAALSLSDTFTTKTQSYWCIIKTQTMRTITVCYYYDCHYNNNDNNNKTIIIIVNDSLILLLILLLNNNTIFFYSNVIIIAAIINSENSSKLFLY